MTNKHLDRALKAARDATRDAYNMATEPDEFREADVKYAQALIAELLQDVIPPFLRQLNPRYFSGFSEAIAEIRRRAGLESEG